MPLIDSAVAEVVLGVGLWLITDIGEPGAAHRKTERGPTGAKLGDSGEETGGGNACPGGDHCHCFAGTAARRW